MWIGLSTRLRSDIIGGTRNRTEEWKLCRLLPYRLAMPPQAENYALSSQSRQLNELKFYISLVVGIKTLPMLDSLLKLEKLCQNLLLYSGPKTISTSSPNTDKTALKTRAELAKQIWHQIKLLKVNLRVHIFFLM